MARGEKKRKHTIRPKKRSSVHSRLLTGSKIKVISVYLVFLNQIYRIK